MKKEIKDKRKPKNKMKRKQKPMAWKKRFPWMYQFRSARAKALVPSVWAFAAPCAMPRKPRAEPFSKVSLRNSSIGTLGLCRLCSI